VELAIGGNANYHQDHAKAHPMPNLLVAAVIYDGLCTFEFGIAAEVFGLTRPEMGQDWYSFVTCAASRLPAAAVSRDLLAFPIEDHS